jgi:hypothetical protein
MALRLPVSEAGESIYAQTIRHIVVGIIVHDSGLRSNVGGIEQNDYYDERRPQDHDRHSEFGHAKRSFGHDYGKFRVNHEDQKEAWQGS